MTPSSAAQRGGLETKLLRKIDTRMSILAVVYILNYVSFPVKFDVIEHIKLFGFMTGHGSAQLGWEHSLGP